MDMTDFKDNVSENVVEQTDNVEINLENKEDKSFLGFGRKIETDEGVRNRLAELEVKNIDLDGAKEIWQKKIPESFESMYESHPELRGFIGSVRMATLPEGVYACTGPRMTKEGFTSEIQLSKQMFSKGDLEWKIVDMERENFKGERWFAGNGLDGILKHEMAHAMHLKMIADEVGLKPGDESSEKFSEVQEKFNRNAIAVTMCYDTLKELDISPKDTGKVLSVYGASDFGEFFAEAIGEYESSKKPRAVATKVHEKYQDYIKEKEGLI